MSQWSWLATKLNGDGTETILAQDIPFGQANQTNAPGGGRFDSTLAAGGTTTTQTQLTCSLSAADAITASIGAEVPRLQNTDLTSIFVPWSTALYAVKDGQIRCGGIVTLTAEQGAFLTVTATGFTGYLAGMPYYGSKSWVQGDPLDVVREAWREPQSWPQGNIGLTVDTTTSIYNSREHTGPVGVFSTGIPATGATPLGTTAQPYVLAWYQNTDLGTTVDDLAQSTPFDYAVRHTLEGDGTITHFLQLGYPTLHRVRDDLRFVVGENIVLAPEVDKDGSLYADGVLVLGSGTGRAMIHASWTKNTTGQLRRIEVVTDQTITSTAQATDRATFEAKMLDGDINMQTVTVIDHPNAPIGSFAVGDVITVEGAGAGWGGGIRLPVRILSWSAIPDQSATAVLTVAQAGRTL